MYFFQVSLPLLSIGWENRLVSNITFLELIFIMLVSLTVLKSFRLSKFCFHGWNVEITVSPLHVSSDS